MSAGGKVFAVLGPTAAGKTAVGIRLAQTLDGEIVSVDSRQIYRELDIGTAKPTAAERAAARHHLIDVVSPAQKYSAALFQKEADAAIAEIRSRGKLPILVGGAGLYYRALVDGLFEGPSADTEARRRLEAEADARGNERLMERLYKVDREAAERIHPNDRMRLIRALEVYELTGRPISELRREWRGKPPRYEASAVALRRPREQLNRRINARVKRMLADGLLEETQALRATYARSDPAFNGFGYAELWDYLDGKHTFEKALELLKRNTRRYAKRQMTWFRADLRIQWIDLSEDASAESAAEAALAVRRRAL
ncbi:MAG: tRNA (adenosine(37)-N6)-dimethylallyltransferase MiaA [Candidatus Poribacteria bacterium]|nr:tRNA (adenosine(37)-N6)-dimethylallyltransferase MiaA [Candidatus Poribacteria bacterium]